MSDTHRKLTVLKDFQDEFGGEYQLTLKWDGDTMLISVFVPSKKLKFDSICDIKVIEKEVFYNSLVLGMEAILNKVKTTNP